MSTPPANPGPVALWHLSTPELAERWSCSVRWLERLRSEGSGPAYLKLSSRVLYPLSAVEQYESARLVHPRDGAA